MIWSRRRGVVNRLGFDPDQGRPEQIEAAVPAGKARRARQRALLAQVPEFPDRYNPEEARPPARRPSSVEPDSTPAKQSRLRITSISDDDMPPEYRPSRSAADQISGISGLDPDLELELEGLTSTHPPADFNTQFVRNMLFGEEDPRGLPREHGPAHAPLDQEIGSSSSAAVRVTESTSSTPLSELESNT